MIPANREILEIGEYGLLDLNAQLLDKSKQLDELLSRNQTQCRDYDYFIVRREDKGLVLLRDFILMDNQMDWKKWMGADPASDVLDSSRASEVLYAMLEQVAQKKRGAAYVSAKKISQSISGSSAGEIGQIGIAENFVENLMTPGDLVIYNPPTNIKANDVVSVMFPGANEDNIELKHFRVVSPESEESIVLTPMKQGGKQFKCPKRNVIGRLVEVILFESKEWKELSTMLVSKKTIASTIQTALKSIGEVESKEEDSNSLEGKIRSELQRRIQTLI